MTRLAMDGFVILLVEMFLTFCLLGLTIAVTENVVDKRDKKQ